MQQYFPILSIFCKLPFKADGIDVTGGEIRESQALGGTRAAW
jgi:hypothetical protein